MENKTITTGIPFLAENKHYLSLSQNIPPPTRDLPQAEQPHFDPGVLVEDLPGLHQAPLVPLGHVLVSWQRVASTHSLRRSHRSHQIVLQNFPLRLLPDSPDDAVVVDLPVVLLLLTPR